MNPVRQELHAIAAAVMFFTRLPVPAGWGETRADLQRAAAYFPLVGWLVGAFAAAVWWLARLEWGPAVASGLSLAATLLLTGAMHEDGFADSCDGFGGGYTRERVLEIMRDSRIGAFGAIGVVTMLGLKWQAVAALPATLAPALLIGGHVVSRAVSTSVMASLVYVREDAAKAKPLATELSAARLGLVVATALAAFALLPPRVWWAALVLLGVRAVLVRWLRHRLGGYTGDCLGAVQQASEVIFYLVAIALA
jgi:adenosylcobinamide-GDP ribazoletransferase